MFKILHIAWTNLSVIFRRHESIDTADQWFPGAACEGGDWLPNRS